VITTPLRHQLPVDVVEEEEPRSNTSRSGGLRRITPTRPSLVSRQEGGRHDRSTYDTPAKLPSSGLAGHSRKLVLTGRDCRDDRTRPPPNTKPKGPKLAGPSRPLLALGSPRWVSQVLATSV
jgi:hypothetical protein